MRAASRPLLLAAGATSFLTRLPIGRWVAVDGPTVAAAAPLYPLVGAGIGAAGGVTVALLSGPLPGAAAATIAVATVAVVTGAMHLDALADAADALGGTSPARRLEIMRDHAVGSFGAAAVALGVVLLVALVAELDAAGTAVEAWAAAAAVGRAAALPLSWRLPYVRPDGQGRALSRARGREAVAGAGVAAAIVLLALGANGLWLVAAAAATTAACGAFFRRWIGGVTGDALGATIQLAELAALATAVAVL